MRLRLFIGGFHFVLGVGLLLLWFSWQDAWAVVVSLGLAGVVVSVASRRVLEERP
jgi:small-conductance mechanosensitive channel